MDDVVKRISNTPQPELESKDPRFVYYIKSNYVATIIDYDMSQVYLPFEKEGQGTVLSRFGKPEPDSTEEYISNRYPVNDNHSGRVRDFIKFLGFVVHHALTMQTHNSFHLLMADLYLDTARPYLTIYTADAKRRYPDIFKETLPLLNFEEKVQAIQEDRANYFRLTEKQALLIADGTINMNLFLSNCRRLVPQHYLSRTLHVYELKPDPNNDVSLVTDSTPEMLESDRSAETAMRAPVLKCRNECLQQNDVYEKILTRNPSEELLQALRFGTENIAHHASRLQHSRLLFGGSPVTVRSRISQIGQNAQPETKKETVEYRQVVQERLNNFLNQNRQSTVDHSQTILEKVEELLRVIRLGLDKNSVLPDPTRFHQNYPINLWSGVSAYKEILQEIFSVVTACREAIALNNGLVVIRADLAGKNRARLIQYTELINLYFERVLLPWRNKIIALIANNFFQRGEEKVNSDMNLNITSKIPVAIAFDPIY